MQPNSVYADRGSSSVLGEKIMSSTPTLRVISEAHVPLDRDVFLRSLIRGLAGTLEEVVGMKDASGYISVVGRKIGQHRCRHRRSRWCRA